MACRPLGSILPGVIVTIGRRAIAWNLERASTLDGDEARAAFRSADNIRIRLDLAWAELI